MLRCTPSKFRSATALALNMPTTRIAAMTPAISWRSSACQQLQLSGRKTPEWQTSHVRCFATTTDSPDSPSPASSSTIASTNMSSTSTSSNTNATLAPPSPTRTLSAGGLAAIQDRFFNQDLGFSQSARSAHNLRGLLPHTQETLAQQCQRALLQLSTKDTPLGKYIYLSHIRQTNARLFFALVRDNLFDLVPILYTPTVGEACEKYSQIYRRPEGLYISLADRGSIREALLNWPLRDQARISVVTDGSRILGLGDLGINGHPITVGKLSLYVAGAGIRPESTLPIVLDMGTDNEALLKDPLYLGLKEKRRPLSEVTSFVDEFMDAMAEVFPKVVVQFEDFSSEAAFHYLERYRHKFPMFNDDIQGTGCVILSGFINAAVQASKASGLPLADQKIVFLGAGSAAVGVAKQLLSFFKINGVSEEEAKKRFWLVDTKGLVTLDRGDKLAEHKVFFARDDNEGEQFKSLAQVVEYVKPTALIGLSTTYGAFSQDVVEKMAELNPRPIIMPLSNPTSKSECSFEQASNWTKGAVIFGAGSPFPIMTDCNGKRQEPQQSNNFYVFPHIGLGALLSGATQVTDHMLEETSLALAKSLNEEEVAAGLLYPRLARLQEISASIALRVMRGAQRDGVDRTVKYRDVSDAELLKTIKAKQFQPSYDELPARF